MEYGMETEWILLWFWGTFNALLSYFYCYFHCYVLTFLSLSPPKLISHSKISVPFLLQQIHSFQECLLFSYSLSKFKRYRRFYGSVSVWEENRSPHLFCMSHSFYSPLQRMEKEGKGDPLPPFFVTGIHLFVCILYHEKVRKWEGERKEIECERKEGDWVRNRSECNATRSKRTFGKLRSVCVWNKKTKSFSFPTSSFSFPTSSSSLCKF